MNRDQNLRADQVAEILQCSVRHVYNLVSEGHFKIFYIGKPGRGLRIKESSVIDFEERRKELAEVERGIMANF